MKIRFSFLSAKEDIKNSIRVHRESKKREKKKKQRDKQPKVESSYWE